MQLKLLKMDAKTRVEQFKKKEKEEGSLFSMNLLLVYPSILTIKQSKLSYKLNKYLRVNNPIKLYKLL